VVTVVKDGRLSDPGVIYRAFGIRPCGKDVEPSILAP
jgi:hypothetical protein